MADTTSADTSSSVQSRRPGTHSSSVPRNSGGSHFRSSHSSRRRRSRQEEEETFSLKKRFDSQEIIVKRQRTEDSLDAHLTDQESLLADLVSSSSSARPLRPRSGRSSGGDDDPSEGRVPSIFAGEEFDRAPKGSVDQFLASGCFQVVEEDGDEIVLEILSPVRAGARVWRMECFVKQDRSQGSPFMFIPDDRPWKQQSRHQKQ